MSVLSAHFKLFDHNSKLGLAMFALAAVFLVLPAVIASHAHRNAWWFFMAALILMPAVMAAFTAETQKNLMSCGGSFLLPNLERTVLRAQGVVMAIVGTSVFLVAYLSPTLAPLIQGAFPTALALTLMTLALYCLVLLGNWLFAYAASVMSILVLPYLMLIKMGKVASLAAYRDFFSHAGTIIPVCAAIMLLAYLIVSRSHLTRRLAEQPYLSPLDLYRPAKARRFRNLRAARQGTAAAGRRPLQGWMDSCLDRAQRARSAGNESTALAWESLYLGLTEAVPRQWWKAGLLGLVLVLFSLATGYFDSRYASDPGGGLYCWFSAFPFSFTLIPATLIKYLDTGLPGHPRSRAANLAAAGRLLGWIVPVVAALSGLVWVLFRLAPALLPTLEIGSRSWYFLAPQRPHVPFLPLLVLPAMLVVYLLWRRSSAPSILSIAGFEIFILLHAVLNMGGYGWPLVAVLAVSCASGAAVPFLWRRRMRRDWA